ncbi:MAG: peptidylprolyl isomerase [Pseudomonadota bacterium]
MQDNPLDDPVLPPGDGPGPNLEITVAGEAEGTIIVDLLPEVAPLHVGRVVALAEAGDYNDIVFHRVIDGFMAQTGDVQFGGADGELDRAGMGGSDLGDLPAEFSEIPFERGIVGMARAASPDSANSQFFIMFDRAPTLDREYTVFGRVIAGMEVVDAIKRGDRSRNGSVENPDRMVEVRVVE